MSFYFDPPRAGRTAVARRCRAESKCRRSEQRSRASGASSQSAIPAVEIAECEAAAMGVDEKWRAHDAAWPIEPTANAAPGCSNVEVPFLVEWHRAFVEESRDARECGARDPRSVDRPAAVPVWRSTALAGAACGRCAPPPGGTGGAVYWEWRSRSGSRRLCQCRLGPSGCGAQRRTTTSRGPLG